MLILLLLALVAAEANWPSLEGWADDGTRAQRDVSSHVPINQLNAFGVSLNSLVFNQEGYTFSALSTVQTLLNVKLGVLMVDLYWNEFTQTWQLCPAPFPNNSTSNLTAIVDVDWNGRLYKCLPGFSTSDLMGAIGGSLRSSNIDLNANVVHLMYNLKLIFWLGNATKVPAQYVSSDPRYLLVGNSSLAHTLDPLSSFLFTPADLDIYRSVGNASALYPTQHEFLFSMFKRITVSVLTLQIRRSSMAYNISASDMDTVFFRNETRVLSTADPTHLDSCSDLEDNGDPESFEAAANSRNITIITDTRRPLDNATLHRFMQCGYVPILNRSLYELVSGASSDVGQIVSDFIPYLFWSWAPNQPSVGKRNSSGPALLRRDDEYDSDNPWEDLSELQFAYNCVSVSLDGLAADNCYNKYRLACVRTDNVYDWTISDKPVTYFDTKLYNCPGNYTFSVPHSSLEQLALLALLKELNVDHPVWVDFNDVTIAGCYVSFGPYTECPYKKVVSTSNFIHQVAPSSVVAFILLVAIFYERFLYTTPIHTNRRRTWKRRIGQYYKENDYEGVPS